MGTFSLRRRDDLAKEWENLNRALASLKLASICGATHATRHRRSVPQVITIVFRSVSSVPHRRPFRESVTPHE
jgi:hypothetical protein